MTSVGRRFAWGAVVLALAVALASLGCTDRKGPRDQTGVTLDQPPAALDPPSVVPRDVQELPVEIVNGQFASDVYSAQPGPTALIVTSHGTAHTLSIDGLVQPRQVPAESTVRIGFTAPEPGEHTMHLDQGKDSALLNVRPIGGR